VNFTRIKVVDSLGSALMKIRKEVCLKEGLRIIIGGGRLYNYCLYADKMFPHKYAKLVVSKNLLDPVLSFQHKNEFRYIKILANYLPDRRSLNFASFIEWSRASYSDW
jgi:dihydrofolate reductase